MNTDTRAPASSGADIADWRPEDDLFWDQTGKRIAYRNPGCPFRRCCAASPSGACGESSACRC